MMQLEISPSLLFSIIGIALLFLVVIPIIACKQSSSAYSHFDPLQGILIRTQVRAARARQAAQSDVEANVTRRQQEVKRSETILTLPTYERDVNTEEEINKFEAEIKRLEAEPDLPENRTLLAQLKAEVARLSRLSSASSGESSTSSTSSPVAIPPPTYIRLNTLHHDRSS
ncbi:hypothetical protein BJ165DRAFT_897045 [Panaeolus papilionaceus]|nr:hypothetical protein BJ165DRAFT_897045 [Panaeolus papilionaceus]